jgi:hypothetical protein
MKVLNRQLSTITIVLGIMASGMAQAGDKDSIVVSSLGEFDRGGLSQPLPKAQAGKQAVTQQNTAAAQSAQERQLAERKAEFVRRIFWMALLTR